MPEMKTWLERRREKIRTAKTYKKKKELLRIFFEDYSIFFELPKTTLSGSVQAMVIKILAKNPSL